MSFGPDIIASHIEHVFMMGARSGEIRCKNCFVGAWSPGSLAHLCNGSQQACKRSSLSAWKAEEWLREAGPHATALQAEAVGVALASADASSRRGGSVAATSAKPPCIYSSLRHGAWAKKKRLQHWQTSVKIH